MNNKLKGAVFIAISAFFYASYGIWSKLMMGSFGEFNQAWIRGLLLLLILVPFGLWKKKFKKISKKDLKWFLVVAFSGGLNQAPYFYGFEHLQVGTATLLFYTMLTIGAYLIGKFFFGERITLIKYLSLILAMIGLALIYSFSLTANQIMPALLVIIAGFMGASIVVFSKKLSSSYSETQILTGVFGIMFLSNLLISMGLKENLPSIDNFMPLFSQLGYTGALLLANLAVILGFKYLEPSIGALIGLLEVIFAIIFGLLFFGEILSLGTISGILLVLFAIALPDFKRILMKT